ncbi:MAG TPA: hypothetical protein VJO35_02995 [Terriglobales bacterium]|nr:hypothetical protein [Terriglobales bacterium]
MRHFAKLAVAVLTLALFVSAQDRPRVFVQGKGSQDVNTTGESGGGQHWGVFGSKSTIDSHDESMEITKDLQKNCSGVIITLNQANADYTVLMNRESKKNRGLLRSNSQIEVASKSGDILGTNATHTVGNAAKDACNLIVADWASHAGSLAPVSAAPVANAASQVRPVTPAVSPNGAVSATTPVALSPNPETQAKQHQACLDLAKDNPSIVCK